MNWADYVILGVVALSALMSLLRGFVVEVLSLVIWISAGFVALTFGDPVAALIGARVDVPSVRLMIAYVGLFLLVLLTGAVISWLVQLLVKKTGLSATDRMLGMLFGALRGGLIILLLVMVAGFTPVPKDPWWQESRLLPGFSAGADLLAARLPDLMREHLDFQAAVEKVLQSTQPADPAPPERPAPPSYFSKDS